MTERVNIHSLAHFGENYKIVKIEVTQDPKKHTFANFQINLTKTTFSGPASERLHF